jgi:hypothetical protein
VEHGFLVCIDKPAEAVERRSIVGRAQHGRP